MTEERTPEDHFLKVKHLPDCKAEGEEVNVLELPFAKAIAMMEQGEIQDVKPSSCCNMHSGKAWCESSLRTQ